MPCDAIAVVVVRITIDTVDEILANANARTALANWLKDTFGTAEVEESTDKYMRVQLGTYPNNYSLRLYKGGKAEVKAEGYRANETDARRMLEEQIGPFINKLAKLNVENRLVAAVKKGRSVVSDQQVPGGGRLITLRV
jgi:hypothetical protein